MGGPTTALAAAAAAAPQVAAVEDVPGGAHSVVEEPEPEPVDQDAQEVRADSDPVQQVPAPAAQNAPQADLPPRTGSQAERTLNLLNQRLTDLRVPEHTYRIGEPAPQTWYLEQVDEGWQVGWFDGEFSSPMLFDEVADASAFLLGKLLLGVPAESALHDPVGHQLGHQVVAHDERIEPLVAPIEEDDTAQQPAAVDHGPDEHEAVPQAVEDDPSVREPVHVNEPPVPVGGGVNGIAAMAGMNGVNGMEARPEPISPMPQQMQEQRPDQHADQGHPNQMANNRAPEQAGPPPEWPIQPLAGEPPLTLFRGKRLLELQPGTELDRFGTPEGNLTYVAGTPFEQRSLVPDWVHRPYHVYRVIRPVQALTGGAIPWFDQPGGGTAYLLSRAVDELIGAGDLMEIEPAEPPAG